MRRAQRISVTLSDLDLFKYVIHQKPVASVSSPVSWLGTVLVAVIVFVIPYVTLHKYSSHPSSISRDMVRRDPSLSVISSPFGIVTLRGDRNTLFYNESFFKFRFRYRFVFNGGHKQLERREQVELPATSCAVNYDLSDDSDSRVLLANAGSGQPAHMGCIDIPAARSLLGEKMSEGMSLIGPDLYLVGKYSDVEYRFLQVDLLPCRDYGVRDNISCATEEEVTDLFQAGVRLQVDFLDRLAPRRVMWNKVYADFVQDEWRGIEVYHRMIRHVEEDQHFPSFVDSVETQFACYQKHQMRHSHWKPGWTYVTLYMRLDALVENVVVDYYSLESVAQDIGSYDFFFTTILAVVLISINRLLYATAWRAWPEHPQGGIAELEEAKASGSEVGKSTSQTETVQAKSSRDVDEIPMVISEKPCLMIEVPTKEQIRDREGRRQVTL
mmetsp:Transcript_130571/g.279169  ORF Transcript_130571/g.279169 Transcript_130571/m.279169 type:complete len:440 (+) Transcript_130571:44-1363(+)